MPNIDNLKIKQKTKKFEKIAYRPWDTEAFESPSEKQSNIVSSPQSAESSEFNNTSYVISENLQKFEYNFRLLHGLQRNIIIFLCNKISHEDQYFAYTFPFTLDSLTEFTNSTKPSVAATLLRLKQKKLIDSFQNKQGRGGFTSYKIEKDFCKYVRLNSDSALFKK